MTYVKTQIPHAQIYKLHTEKKYYFKVFKNLYKIQFCIDS